MIIEKLEKKDIKMTSLLFSNIFDSMSHVFPERAINAFKFENSESEISRLIEQKNRIYLIAKEGENVIGIAQGYHYGGVFYLVWMAVDENNRGKGIGRKLLKRLENEASKNCHKIYLISAVGLNSIGFYEKNGYEKEGLLRNAWWGVDYYSLGKKLKF